MTIPTPTIPTRRLTEGEKLCYQLGYEFGRDSDEPMTDTRIDARARLQHVQGWNKPLRFYTGPWQAFMRGCRDGEAAR